MSKILILQSVQDEITYFRELYIKNSPLLQDHKFEHIYAIELTEQQKMLPVESMMMQVEQSSLDEKDLFDRLIEKINVFSPDILIVHGGFVFLRFQIEMLSALKSVKDKLPKLRIGIETRFIFNDQLELSEIFEHSDEIETLISRIF